MFCPLDPERVHGQRRGGLSLLQGTNLTYFMPPQKAELLRVRALFFRELSSHDGSRWYEANRTFALAVQVHDRHRKAWLSWGRFLDTLFHSVYLAHVRQYEAMGGQTVGGRLPDDHDLSDLARRQAESECDHVAAEAVADALRGWSPDDDAKAQHEEEASVKKHKEDTEAAKQAASAGL